LKNALAIVTLSALLPALAATAQAQPASTPLHPQTHSVQLAAAPAKTAAEKSAPAETSLPSNVLTEEMMFKLLRAEMAYQRGDWQMAFVTMLISAQETRDPRLARRAAEIALSVKQTGEALSAVRLWRQLDPESDEASQFYLGLVVLGENLAEAKPIFVERLTEVRPQARGLLILQIQRLLGGVKDKQGAFKLMEELVAPYPNLVESHIALAQAAFANNDAARAQQEALAALKIKPDLEIAVLMAAQTMPNRSQAQAFLNDHLKKYPKAREIRIAYAKILIDDKQYDKAREQFDVLLKDQPKDLTILYAMGILGAQMNDRAMAEKYLTAYLKELEANPDETRDPVQALLILSQIAADRKDYPAALKWLAQVEPGPAYLEAQVKSAQIMAQSGDVDGAHNILSHLKPEGQTEQIQILIADAQLMRDANRMPEAMTIMENGLKQFPEDTGLLYDYAMLAEKAQRFDKMETALRKIIQIAPENQHAYNALGYSLADRNVRLPEALKLLQKASELAPEDPFIMDSVGWVYFRLGRLTEAEDYLRRAYAIRPDAEIGVHLGEVLWLKGQKEDAQNLWRAAQQKDPDNETLRSTLTRLRISL